MHKVTQERVTGIKLVSYVKNGYLDYEILKYYIVSVVDADYMTREFFRFNAQPCNGMPEVMYVPSKLNTSQRT